MMMAWQNGHNRYLMVGLLLPGACCPLHFPVSASACVGFTTKVLHELRTALIAEGLPVLPVFAPWGDKLAGVTGTIAVHVQLPDHD